MASSASDPAPLIGVTTYLEQAQTGVWDVPASFLPKVYLDAVTDAGGIALLLPPQPLSTDRPKRPARLSEHREHILGGPNQPRLDATGQRVVEQPLGLRAR